jgi:hypothetical protein
LSNETDVDELSGLRKFLDALEGTGRYKLIIKSAGRDVTKREIAGLKKEIIYLEKCLMRLKTPDTPRT